MDRLRVGIIGCGQIAQIMHLPYLKELPQYEIGAVCDISTTVVNTVGEWYGVKDRYVDYQELLDQPDIDIVAILTMDHSDIAEAAADAGKHIFVEKPFCFDPAEGKRVLSAVKRAGVKLMVGYMKRYDPGYEYGMARMRAMQDVRLIRVHDFAGDFSVHEPLYTLVTGDDIPQSVLDDGAAKIEAASKAALGPSHAHLSGLYNMLLMLSSHDLAILRGAFGAAEGVLFSDAISPTEILSVLDFGPQRRCVFEAGVWPDYLWWDEQLTAYGKSETISIAFPNPYVKYAPTTVTIQQNEDGSPITKVAPASHEEAFRREWLLFYDCIREDSEARTTGADANADVELAVEMIRAIQAR
ncbi:MAG: Gfo/Idh/MocA family oxidoreductase [Chloroflexi bacterium]|nr:Gfo/Idh/MocA family oxidoreductase [Chloroflexota bacterium]